MVLLSCERSFTFIRPFAAKKLLKSRTICLILIGVTCLCFTLHIDEIVFVDIKAFRWVNFAYGLCSIKRYSRLAADRIKIITHSHTFILPFLLNSLLDVYICYKICQQRKRLVKTSISSFVNNKSRRLKISLANEITLTLLCQSMWLLITYFPTNLYYFLISFRFIKDHDRDNSTFVFFIRQNLLIYLAFSPTLFVILSPTLRKDIHLHLYRSYKRRKTISSSFLTSGNKRLEKFFNDHHQQQQQQNRQTHSTILITRSEELQRKFVSISTTLPRTFLMINQSKSTSCLTMYNNHDQFEQYKKLERSSTLHE
jgi:hypothetical protein